jgi:hypothetical protein
LNVVIDMDVLRGAGRRLGARLIKPHQARRAAMFTEVIG